MALIWAEGLTDDKALARLWRAFRVAATRVDDGTLSAAERGAAVVERDTAWQAYQAAITAAAAVAAGVTAQNQARTHVLIVGVGAYDSPGLPPTDTAVWGACAFTEWMLTKFNHPERPLGSLEFLTTPTVGQGEWKPAKDAADRLGLAASDTLATERATFANIKAAFEAWMGRAGSSPDNAAFLYFSGHGVAKSEPMLFPQDGVLPDERHGARNLIAPVRTLNAAQFSPPNTQCYFIDACSEYTLALLQNPAELPAEILWQPASAPLSDQVDTWVYFGCRPGFRAYGPPSAAPFFTQELMASMERRAGDPTKGLSHVTTLSLWQALEAAGPYRAALENQPIGFARRPISQAGITATLCRARDPCETFVVVRCTPLEAMDGKLYIGSGTNATLPRPKASRDPWYMILPYGDAVAAVAFDDDSFDGTFKKFTAWPPVYPVLLKPVARAK